MCVYACVCVRVCVASLSRRTQVPRTRWWLRSCQVDTVGYTPGSGPESIHPWAGPPLDGPWATGSLTRYMAKLMFSRCPITRSMSGTSP